MFTRPEKFIFENLNTMPLWVRVITYLVMLVVVVFGYLTPRYVDGVAYMKLDKSDDEQQYMKSVPYRVVGDGRPMKMTTSEEGLISIPLPSLLTTKVIQIDISPDGHNGHVHSVFIPLKNIYQGEFTLTYEIQDDVIEVTSIESARKNKSPLNFMVSSAYANDEPPSVQEITNHVIKVVSKVSGKPRDQIKMDDNLNELINSSVKLGYIYGSLEPKFGVVVRRATWEEASTVNDLRKILYVATNKSKESDNFIKYEDWKNIELPDHLVAGP